MLALLRRYPDFRRLWLAQVVSQGGDWLSRMAVLALIGSLGGSAAGAGVGALFGVELALRLLPTAVFGPLAGAVADRVSRRALMVTTDIARAGIVLLMLFVDEPGELPVLYVLVFAQMGLAIFFNAARAAALPSTVSGDDLHGAYTLSAATWSAISERCLAWFSRLCSSHRARSRLPRPSCSIWLPAHSRVPSAATRAKCTWAERKATRWLR